MHTTNIVPTIVERSARKAAHRFCHDRIRIGWMKVSAHRAYRHRMKRHVDCIAKGFIDPDDYDDTPTSRQRLTSWDVW